MTSTRDTVARPAGAAEPADGKFLTFLLRERTFGIGIESVMEIIRFESVTAVPRTPAHIRGIMNVRGSVLPVLDMNAYVGQARSESAAQSCIVIIEAVGAKGTWRIGLMVDSVAAVITVAAGAIETAPPFGIGLRRQLLLGTLRQNEQFVFLLDVAQAFSVAELGPSRWTRARICEPAMESA